MMDGRGVWLMTLMQGMISTVVFAPKRESTSRLAQFLTRENKCFKGHVVKRFESPILLSCGQRCLRNVWWTSTNYKAFSKKDKIGTCELNEHEISLVNGNTAKQEGVTMRLEGCLVTGCLNGGSCLLDENEETFSSCSHKPPWTGERCEVKLDTAGCSSDSCLNGGTRIDKVNVFRCSCPASLTGMRCELPTGPECSSYSVNKEADRSVSFLKSSRKCDKTTLTPGWYRFNSTAGSEMPSTCVAKYMCNTDTSGWLNGTHPTPQEGVVQRNVCFPWGGKCCKWMATINVRNCGLFYVYQLVKTPVCWLRYCVTK